MSIYPIKICIICNAEFRSITSTNKTCSNSCALSRKRFTKNESQKKYYKRDIVNPEFKKRQTEIKKKYIKLHPKKLKETESKYRIKNKDKIYMRLVERRARAPSWMDQELRNQISVIYDLAKDKTRKTGIKHEVDHIIPIKGKNVCGLHLPWNLQILTRQENIKKGNRICLR